MALSVSSDLTRITDAESGGAGSWSDIGGGSGSIQETDFALQGSQCRSRAVSGAAASRGMIYNNGADLDFSASGAHKDKLIYFWIATFAPGLVDAVSAAPGLTIRIDTSVTPGTNYWEWDIMYSDLLPSEGTEFFKVYVLDPRAPATRTQGSPSLATLRHFGAVMDTNATAKGQNLAIDSIAYGFGEIRASGTATDETSGLEEMVDWDWADKSQRWGVFTRDEAGNVSCKGKIVIGDSVGTAATAFTAQKTKIRWAPPGWYYDGTRVRPTVGYDFNGNFTGRKSDGTAYYGVDLRGNGTGDTDVTLGAIVGSDRGRSGPTFIGSDVLPTEFSGDDGSVEAVALYAANFEEYRYIDLSGNASSDVLYSCTLTDCGPLDIGPVTGRNNIFITGLGGSYKLMERFLNKAATTAEQLSTADPILNWIDVTNGADWSVPTATIGYVELLGGTTRTNITVFGYDAVGSDDHYVDTIVRIPTGGANRGTFGPVIAAHATNSDYFWLEVDYESQTVELWDVSSGTPSSLAGPTAFSMDEDEDYQVLLRRDGTTIEGFISGNSSADGLHTVKLSGTSSNHTGTSQRLVGLRGDAAAAQTGSTGQRPRVRRFGTGPITDLFGSLVFPTTGTLAFQSANFINCSRAWGFYNTGTYTLTGLVLSANLAAAHNDSGGTVTGNVTSASAPSNSNVENLGSATSTFSASVPISVEGVTEGTRCTIHANLGGSPPEAGTEYLSGYANSSGVVSGSYTGSTPASVIIRARNSGIINAAILDDGGAFTDYTNEAREQVGADDVVLLPASPAVNDAFYFGGLAQYGQLRVKVSTAGTGGYVLVWEYWNGAWVTLTVVDNTNSFQTAGWNSVTFAKPGNWALTTVNSQGPFYYTRARVTTAAGTGASGEYISLYDTVRYTPFTGLGTIVAGTGLAATAVWQEDDNAP